VLKILATLAVLLVAAPVHGQPLPRDHGELRRLIVGARDAEGGSGKYAGRDVLRTLIAAGVQITAYEAFSVGQSMMFSQPVEAEAIMAPFFKRGELGAKSGAGPYEKRVWERVQRDAENDRQRGLASAVDYLNRPGAFTDAAIPVAESFLVLGSDQLALDLFRRALATEMLDQDAAATARLGVCRALLALGRVAEAQWELENFPPAPGYDALTRVWLAIAAETEAKLTSNPSSPPPP